MTTACDSCAFGQTGGAANEPSNRIKGLICAYGASPFFCHHSKSGLEYDWRCEFSNLGPLALAPEDRKMCAGWQRYVAALKARGYFANADYRVIRKVVARRACGLLETFTDKETPPEQREFARVELRACMVFIAAKDIGPLEIPL